MKNIPTAKVALSIRDDGQSAWLEEARNALFNKLNNPQYLRDWSYGDDRNTYHISVTGEATGHDKSTIIEQLSKLGYLDVAVTNSSENGESAGMSSIKLVFP